MKTTAMRARSGGLGDLAGTQTAGAHANVSTNPIDIRVNTLKIGALDALGLPVGVADLVLDDALLAADGTLSWHGIGSEGAYV
jgi:hypothetical protein